MGKIISLIISIIYLVVAYTYRGAEDLLRLLLFLMLPLACIWFGDEMGRWTGTIRLHLVTSESPGCLVRFMGWILLLLPAIIGIISIVTNSR